MFRQDLHQDNRDAPRLGGPRASAGAGDGLSAVVAHSMLNSSAAVLLATSTLRQHWQELSTEERIDVLETVERHATDLANAARLLVEPHRSSPTEPAAVARPVAPEGDEALRPNDPSEVTMPKKPQIAVTPREDGRWAVQEIGEERSRKLYDHKGDAEATATARGASCGADVVVEDVDGEIERWDDHDADPPLAHVPD